MAGAPPRFRQRAVPTAERATATTEMWRAIDAADMDVHAFLSAIGNGADFNSRDSRGHTALQRLCDYARNAAPRFAAPGPSAAVVDLLEWEGVLTNVRCHGARFRGWTALHFAANAWRPLQILPALLRHGADVHEVDYMGATPLFYASTPQAVHTLVGAEADPAARTFTGGTPAHTMAFDLAYPVKSMRALLRYPAAVAAVNVRDDTGSTPLHVAITYGRCKELPRLVRTLLDKGADCTVRDNDGMTPLQCGLR